MQALQTYAAEAILLRLAHQCRPPGGGTKTPLLPERKEIRSVSHLLTAETRPSHFKRDAHLHIQTPEVLQALLQPIFTRSVMACSDLGGQSPSVNLAAAAPAGEAPEQEAGRRGTAGKVIALNDVEF